MSLSRRRRWALRLVRWAGRLLPRDRASWGEAMSAEVAHIEDDRAALRWAAGALRAAGAERLGRLLNTGTATWGLALICVWQALTMLFAPVLTVAWRMRWLRVDELLGGTLPGDHYQRFTPLMNATATWQLVLWVAAGLLFLAAAWRLMRHRPGALGIFAAALVLAYLVFCAGWLDRQLHPGLAEIYRQTYTFSTPSLRRDVLLPLASQLVPLLAAVSWWWRDRSLPHA